MWNMRVSMIQVVIGALGTIPESLVKLAGRVGNRRTSRNHQDCNIVEANRNTKSSKGVKMIIILLSK